MNLQTSREALPNNKEVIFLAGRPLAGKEKIGEKLEAELGIPRLVASNILRENKEIADMMANGILVPDEIANQAIIDEIFKVESMVIVDGFPRTPGQANTIESAIKERGNIKSTVVNVDIPQEVAIERAKIRRMEKNRPDDAPEIVERRQNNFNNLTAPAIARMSEAFPTIHIDGNREPKVVYEEVRQQLVACLNGNLRKNDIAN